MAVTREFVQGFLGVRQTYDPAQIAPYLDDKVDWLISGPSAFLPQCGPRKGKAAVVDLICRVNPGTYESRGFEIEELLVQGDYAATLSRFWATHAVSKRSISYRCAHFMRFRDNKLVWYRGLIDSFNATEQLIGHALNVDQAPELISISPDGEVVEI
jgi:ketosteroid isomerase-like protein